MKGTLRNPFVQDIREAVDLAFYRGNRRPSRRMLSFFGRELSIQPGWGLQGEFGSNGLFRAKKSIAYQELAKIARAPTPSGPDDGVVGYSLMLPIVLHALNLVLIFLE